MVSAEKLLGIASQPFTTAPPAFQMVRSLFSRMVNLSSLEWEWGADSADQAGPLVIEGPTGNQELHGSGVVAGAQVHVLVGLMGFFHLGHVDLDAQAGLLGDEHHAALDLEAEASLVHARPFGGADDMAEADGPFAGGAQVAGGAEALVGLDEGEADGGGAAQGGGIGHSLSSEGAGSLRTRAR